ncbi:MAG TPA: acyl carrier protein [Gemmatimonadaceae bacterium]
MSAITEQQLRTLVTAWVRSNSRAPDAKSQRIGDDTDLLATGLLDSLGFVELLAYVEQTTGSAVDLSDADPSEFTTVQGFCRFATRQAN